MAMVLGISDSPTDLGIPNRLLRTVGTKDRDIDHTRVAQQLVEYLQGAKTVDGVQLLIEALKHETTDGAQQLLAQGLAAVAGRLEPREATRVVEQAAGVLTQALEKETDVIRRKWLAQGLAILAQRLDPARASRLCFPLVERLVSTAEQEENEVERIGLIVCGAQMLQAVDQEMAIRYSRKLARIICSGPINVSDAVYTFSVDLDPILTNSSRMELNRRAAAAGALTGLAASRAFAALAPAAGRRRASALPAVHPGPRGPPQDANLLWRYPQDRPPAPRQPLRPHVRQPLGVRPLRAGAPPRPRLHHAAEAAGSAGGEIGARRSGSWIAFRSAISEPR
jgi:hypothetical protein